MGSNILYISGTPLLPSESSAGSLRYYPERTPGSACDNHCGVMRWTDALCPLQFYDDRRGVVNMAEPPLIACEQQSCR